MLESSVFNLNQHNPLYKRQYQNFEFHLCFFVMFENSKFNFQAIVIKKSRIKMFETNILKIWVLAFVEGVLLIPIKIELSSFKIIEGIRSGNLKVIFLEFLKVLHILQACKTIYDTIKRYQCYCIRSA